MSTVERPRPGRPVEPPPSAAQVPARPTPAPAPTALRPSGISAEQWVGQRALLAIGVFLVILAVGYLLKLAFDRGWISPAVRCAGGVLGGLGAAGAGWRLYRRGLRTYGAAIIGLGFGIVYLSIWAATNLYQLVPSGFDIAALALVSFSFALGAYLLDVQALGAAAALGAFLAPVLQHTRGNPDALLSYLALVAATLGVAATVKRWRIATFIVAAAFFSLGAGVAGGAGAGRVLLYGFLGGAAGLFVGLRDSWAETRLLAFAGGWGLIGAAAGRLTPSWPVTLAGLVLAAPTWWRALTSSTVWPDPTGGEPDGPGTWSVREGLYFYVTVALLGWAVGWLSPSWFQGHRGVAALIVGLGYLAAGYSAPRYPFTLAGVGALAFASLAGLEPYTSLHALLGLAMVWASLDHWLDRADGRWYAVATLGLALWRLAATAGERPPGAPAFRDGWAVALWLAIATSAVLAARLWRRIATETPAAAAHPLGRGHRPHAAFRDSLLTARAEWAPRLPGQLWSLTGALILFGITGELRRFFAQAGLAAQTARLWSGLTISAWWALFAGGLVVIGFRRGVKSVRVAGLAVAGLAVGKVLLVDLSMLDALYRIGSVLILGLVSLLVAYLYHRPSAPSGD